MNDVATILPAVLPYATACPEPMAIAAVVAAATRLCERARFWRASREVAYGPDQSGRVAAPPGAIIHEIDEARFGDGGAPIEPIALAWLDQIWPGWATAGEGAPRYVTQVAPDTLRLVPEADGTLTVRLILKPHPDATALPGWMLEQHRETLVAGALARILVTPGQPYANPALAAEFGALFAQDCDRLARREIAGQQRAPARTTARYL